MNPEQGILNDLPGAANIRQGIHDLLENRHTIPACLARISRPRLIRAGLLPAVPGHDTSAELDLYQLLAPEGERAYTRYNALIRELASLGRALDHRLSQQQATPK